MKWLLLLALVTLSCGGEPMPSGYYRSDNKGDPNFTKKTGSSITLAGATESGFGQRKTICDINSNDWQDLKGQLESGAWVATVKSDIVTPLAGSLANPLVILAEYGEGGASTKLEVSPGPGASFQISAGRLRLSAYLETENGPGNPNNIVPPTLQRVSCFVKRGSLSIGARRTFYSQFNPAVIGPQIAVPIPNFANSFLLYSPEIIQPAGGNTYNVNNTAVFSTGATTLAAYDGQQLLAAVLASAPLPIPAGATNFTFVDTTGAIVGGTTLSHEFFLDF